MKDKLRELADRLDVLAHAVTEANWREFSMRVPVEPERDADCVLSQAAIELRSYAAILDASDTYHHSPDAADSGRVDPNIPTELDELRLQLVDATEERDHLRAALTAQGQGEAVAEVCSMFELRWAGGDAISSIVGRNGIKVGDKLYTKPTPPASPAGVLDGWKLAMFVLQSGVYAKLPEEERAVCDALIAENPFIAAPSAPEGDGGAE